MYTQLQNGGGNSAMARLCNLWMGLLDADRHRVGSAVAVSVDEDVVVAGGGEGAGPAGGVVGKGFRCFGIHDHEADFLTWGGELHGHDLAGASAEQIRIGQSY